MKRAIRQGFSVIVFALAMLAVSATAANADGGIGLAIAAGQGGATTSVVTPVGSIGASLAAFPDDPGYGP